MSTEQGFVIKGNISDFRFGTPLSVHLIEGVRLIGGQLNRGFTVVKSIRWSIINAAIG